MTEKTLGSGIGTEIPIAQVVNAGVGDDWAPEMPEDFVEDRGDTVETPAADPEDVKKVVAEVEKPAEEAPTAEEKPAEAPKPEDPDAVRIPKPRFDEVNNRRKAVEAENERLRAELARRDLAPDVNVDLDAKEAAYMEAVLDGDKEKALSIRKEIREAEAAIYGKRALEAAKTVKTEVKGELDIAKIVNELNAEYPLFDSSAEDFNQEALVEAVALARMYQEQKIYGPEDALRKAAEKTAKIYDFAPVSKRKAAADGADPKPKPEDVKKKIEVAGKQPPEAPPGVAATDPEPDINEMSDAEFDRLPEATKRRMRGDYR
jgi:hypothetical protein